jgi:prepilin-type N-terminal cleavage/methylation domain-containing protein
MIKKDSFTLVEMLIVIIIVGIVAAIGMTQFSKTRDYASEKEAFSNLRLIQSAEKIYDMERTVYINCDSASWSDDQEACLNNALRTSLPTESNPNKKWDYESIGSTGCVHARRVSDGVTKCMGIGDAEPRNGTCGAGCP